MASNALMEWRTTARGRLKELEDLHVRATGPLPGRRRNTEQFNRGLLVALMAQFQGFCRALHSEAVDVHVAAASPHQKDLLRRLLTQGRKLDEGSPRRSALGADFGRFGFPFIDAVKAESVAATAALDSLEVLVDFRNAVGHGNEVQINELVAAGAIKPTKACFREYLKTLDGLAVTMDRVAATKLAATLRTPSPW